MYKRYNQNSTSKSVNKEVKATKRRKTAFKKVTKKNVDVSGLNGDHNNDHSLNKEENNENEFKVDGLADFLSNNSAEDQKTDIQGPVSIENMKLQIVSKESKLQFFETILSYLASFPAKEFFNEVIRSEIEECNRNQEIIFGALCIAIQQSTNQLKDSTPKEFKKPATYFDFTMCEDEHFQEMMHVTRKTAKIIIENIRGIPVDVGVNSEISVRRTTHNSEPIDKILFLVLWYFRSKENKLEDAVSLFELGTIENARKYLNRGLQLLLKLKADAGLLWPTSDEFLITASCLERRFSFPNVAGIMGHHVINCENGQRLMLLGVCNEKGMFIDVCTSFDTRPRIVFKQSMLKSKFQELRNGLSIVCEDFSISDKSKRNMLLPYKEGTVESSTEEQLFNLMHDLVIGVIKDTFKHLFRRFPRLNLLDSCEPDIATVACVLHNYCIKLNDLTPL